MHYQQKIMDNQQRYLEPLREDLAEWLNKTLDLDCVTSENIIDMLDTGILLCHLAATIQAKAQSILDESKLENTEAGEDKYSVLSLAKKVPRVKIRCWERAGKGSFFARENASNFIKFCRDLGIHEHLLFESEDLVVHTQPRNVILCLLEVGRIAAGLEMEAPGLVQLEREVDLQIEQYQCGLERNADCAIPNLSNSNGSLNEYAQINRSMTFLKIENAESHQSTSPVEDLSPSLDELKETKRKTTELDNKVEQCALATQAECHCVEKYCEKLSIFKISEGLYRIGDRNIFLRLFKDRHVMVRVGGGWDTLEHYLIRHDPCRKTDPHSSRCTTPDSSHYRVLSSTNGSLSARAVLLASSTPCLNDNKIGEPTTQNRTSRNVNPQRKYVARSLTLDLNQESRTSALCTPKRTTSFTSKWRNTSSAAVKDGANATETTVQSSKLPGFSFSRAKVERNSSFTTTGLRSRPASAVYSTSRKQHI